MLVRCNCHNCQHVHDDAKIPPHLRPALDVSEEEYRMAKFQHRQLWAITMMAGFIGLIAWCLDFQFLDYISQPLACASIAYTAAYQFLKDARKMLTHRMRCYSELAAYRAFHAKKTTELEQSTTTKKTASPE